MDIASQSTDALLENYDQCLERVSNQVAAAVLAAAAVQMEVAALPEFLTVKQAASELQVSDQTIYGLCEDRKLTHMRVGEKSGTIRIPRNALQELCDVTTREKLVELSSHYKPRGKRDRPATPPLATAV